MVNRDGARAETAEAAAEPAEAAREAADVATRGWALPWPVAELEQL